jgi:outer membrane protein TolC
LDSQLVVVQREALAQAEARRQVVEERARAGLASEYDQLTARVAVENLRPVLIRAQNALVLSRNDLKRTLGIPLDRTVALTDTLGYEAIAPMDSAAIAAAARERSDLVAMQKMVRLRDAAIAAERSNALPTLSLTLGLQRHASSRDFIPAEGDFSQSLQVGVQLGWSLFDGRASQGRLLRDRAQRRADEARLAGREADVRLEIEQARQSLEAAQAQVEASRGTVAVAERALTIAQARFANGLATQVELGDAEFAVTQARTNLAQSLYLFNVARAQWQAALGGY